MRSPRIFDTVGLAFAIVQGVACGRERMRTPDEWKTEVGQGFDAHAGVLKACYDDTGLKTKVSITVHLVAGKMEGTGGSSSPIRVQGVDPGSAPATLIDCVKQAASAIEIRPQDAHRASGSWVVTFDPDAAPSISPGVAPKS